MAGISFAVWWRMKTAAEKRVFAAKVNCSLQYLRNIACGNRWPSLRLAKAMKDAADGTLDDIDLRPKSIADKSSVTSKINSYKSK